MGSIGGMLGLSGGAAGTGFSTMPGTNGQQLQDAYNKNVLAESDQGKLLNALNQQNGMGNQNQVYNQLQGVVSGQGPNPAQAMLNQATGANVANQAALMGGQRGAAGNVGLMARQSAQQGANLQQQAAGQGASMQAQQALGALGQAGGMANTMTANQIGQTNAIANAAQNEQNILQGANTANNQNQSGMAQTQMKGQQGLIGGILGGAGAAMGLAQGGPVPTDGGSAFGPQSMFGDFLHKTSQTMSDSTDSQDHEAAALQKGVTQFGTGLGTALQSKAPSIESTSMAPAAQNVLGFMGAAHGGKVPAMVSPGERFLKPEEAKAVSQGKVDPTKVGEKIPGKAKVKGDSYKNDTVRKDLEVGGLVLPRTVENSKNPGAEAKKFVDAYMAKRKRA